MLVYNVYVMYILSRVENSEYIHIELRFFTLFGSPDGSVLRDTTQLWYSFHDGYSTSVVASSVLKFASRFSCVELTLGRMPIFTRRSRASTFSNNICTVVGEWHHGYFCLAYFFSSTHFYLVSWIAQKVWRHCGVGFCARPLLSCPKLHWSPFEHWLFSFHR